MGFARYPLCAPDPWAVSSSQPMAPMSIIHLLLTPVLPSKGAKPTFPKHVSEHKQASHNKALQTIGIYILTELSRVYSVPVSSWYNLSCIGCQQSRVVGVITPNWIEFEAQRGYATCPRSCNRAGSQKSRYFHFNSNMPRFASLPPTLFCNSWWHLCPKSVTSRHLDA